jgi:hypothetical protein
MNDSKQMATSSNYRLDHQPLGSTLEHKLLELRAELAKGRNHLELLEQRSQEIRNTLLRITGAIQVLEELLQQQDGGGATEEAFPNSRSAPLEPVT